MPPAAFLLLPSPPEGEGLGVRGIPLRNEIPLTPYPLPPGERGKRCRKRPPDHGTVKASRYS
jgi:hypothetical protein